MNTGLIFTNTNTVSNNPFVWFQDSSNDAGVVPVLEVSGGQAAFTLGLEITSQFNSSVTTVAPPWSTMMPQGFGGLSLVQNSPAVPANGIASPSFAMCGSQYGNNTGTNQAGPACWYWQVQGGSNSNPPDVLQLFRNNYANATTDLTVLFPAAINLATAPLGGLTPSAGQITVGPMPYNMANANVLATFTGASTSYATGAHAGPAVIQAGQLTAPASLPPDSASTEGSFQIMQSYRGSLGTSSANVGMLACPDTTTTQGVVPCAVGGQAENWVGVYNNNQAQVASLATPGVTVTPTRYGRVTVNSKLAAKWLLGDYVCKDDTNGGYSFDNNTSGTNNVPCSAGESIGIVALGETATNTTHTIDLVPAPSQQSGAVMTFFCSTGLGVGNVFVFPSAQSTSCGFDQHLSCYAACKLFWNDQEFGGDILGSSEWNDS